jgi:hypothetical protein
MRLAFAICLASLGSLVFWLPGAQSPHVAKFVVRTDPHWDKFTGSPNATQQEWFRTHIWRMMVFSPYFDRRLSWYPNAWVYFDLYGIHLNTKLAQEHKDWLLKDDKGNPLYIPWGCDSGTCPQYAADPGDARFVQWWIANARGIVSHGYRGLWIDDVNMEMRVSDSHGKLVVPLDPRTGAPMTYAAWKKYIAAFVEKVRGAFPEKEIVHNAIWFAGGKQRDADPEVIREIRAADFVNCERGVTDPGLHGSAEWSLNAFLGYIDHVHLLGRGVILDNGPGHLEYALSSYFLISSGKDGMGDQAVTPDNWWPGLNIDPGAPLGKRDTWNGLLRRAFERGIVLVNPPGNPPRNIAHLDAFRRTDQSSLSSLTLAPGDGIVLLRKPNEPVGADSAITVSANDSHGKPAKADY